MLTCPATPLVTISTITYSHSTFFGHHIFLLLLLCLRLSLLCIFRPQQLSPITIASSHSRHLLPYQAYDYNQIKTMLNPIKHLSGKLTHLHIPQTRYLRIVELANSIRPSKESTGLGEVSVEDINALKSDTTNVDARTYHKFCFELQVHTESSVFALPSTIFDELGPHEKKISHLISTYASRLNTRQLLYLNLAFRAKLNGEFPTWSNLHLSEESPSKMDLQVLPTLSAGSRIPELKALPKIPVMKEVVAAKKTAA